MNRTAIEWTDYSWPIVNGCTRVSPGCTSCYAERLSATRLRSHPKYAGLARMHNGDARWTGEVRPWPEALDEPLRLRKPSRIFVADMGDLFHEKVPEAFIDRVFAVMALTSMAMPKRPIGHTFQVLTKRAERMRDYIAAPNRGEQVARWMCTFGVPRLPPPDRVPAHLVPRWPLAGVWLGVSVEDQQRADERIPLLLQTPAALRFLSVEPLLGPVELNLWRQGHFNGERALGLVIVGGESGPRARPCDVNWIRSVVAQCKAASVPCFTKQWGSRPIRGGSLVKLSDRKGGDRLEWGEGDWPREFPDAT